MMEEELFSPKTVHPWTSGLRTYFTWLGLDFHEQVTGRYCSQKHLVEAELVDQTLCHIGRKFGTACF